MTPNFLIYLLLVVIKVNFVIGQGCSLGNELKDYKPGGHTFKDVDVLIKEFNGFTNINKDEISISSCGSGNKMEYATYEVENDKLILKTKDMEGFEETRESSDSLQDFCVHLKINCENFDKDLVFYVDDTNNHDPYFVDERLTNQTTFSFEIPMPFPPNIGLEALGPKYQLWARDIDISNTKVDFTIEPNDYFKIDYKEPVENYLNKVHAATLVAKQFINFDVNDFKITVTDKGDRVRKAEAKITIKRSEVPGQIPVEFEKYVYEGEYEENSNVINIKDKIILKVYENLSIKVENYENNFSGSIEANGEVKINVIKPIENIVDDYIILSVQAKDNTGKTVAETSVVTKIIKKPTASFEKDSYEGELDLSNNKIENLPEIKIDYPPENVEGRIEETEYRDHFDISFDETKQTFTLVYKKPIDVKDKKLISFTLQAINDKMETVANTIVILTLKNKPIPRFLKDSYEGEIDLSTEDIENFPEIEIVNPPENVDGQIEQTEYRDNFDISFDETKQTFTLVYKKPIDVKDKKLISFTLQAINDKMETVANTIVILTLINKPIPRFLKDSYEGEIDLSTEDIENLPEIKIVNPPENVDGQIEQTEYRDHFDISFDETKQKFTLVYKKPIDVTDKKLISFTLQAINDKMETVANTIVILTLINEPIPRFLKDSYEGEIDLSTEDIENLPEIKIVNPPENVDGQIEQTEYRDHFDISFDETKQTFTLVYKKPIDVTDKKLISFTLQAINDKMETVANTIVILTLINKPIPRFLKDSYEGEIDLSTEDIENLPEIKIVNPPENVDGQIEQTEYRDHFDISFDETKQKFTLVYKKPIDVTDKKLISFTLQAINDKMETVANTIVILTLINKPIPRFLKDSYEGEIDLSTEDIENLPEIKIVNPPENVDGQIEQTEYRDHFDISFDETKQTFTLVYKKPIDVTDKKLISFTLQAINDKMETVANTIVILTLINKPIPRFLKDSYEGEIDLSTEDIENLPEIKIVNPPENVDGQIEQTEYRDHFDISFDETKQTFTLVYKKPIDVTDKKLISFTLQAINDKMETVANTIVILTLINKPIPRFLKDSYEGEIDLSTEDIENLPEIKIVNPPENVDGQIEQTEYRDHFDISFDETKQTFTLVYKKPIDVTDKKLISFTLQAINDKMETVANTIVILTLKNKPIPRFLKDSYEGEIDLSTEDIENLPEIEIVNPPENVDGQIEQTEYRDHFDISFDETKQTFTLVYKKPIDVTDKKLISFTLQAINDKMETVANTIVILTLKNKPIPRFLKDSYEGEIDLSTEDIENLPEIEIVNPPENVDGQIEQTEYRDNFDISFHETKQTFTLVYKKPIDVKDKKLISFTLQAVNDKKEMVANTIVILTLKNRPIPRFLKDSYQGEIDLGTEKIEKLPEIIIENPPESVNGRIEQGEYQNKFSVTFNNKTKTFQVVPTKPLDFVDIQVISFKLEAINENQDTLASTIVILTLTNKTIRKFNQDSYEGELNFKNQLIEKLPVIKMDNPPENVEGRIEPGEYEDKFHFGFSPRTNTFDLEFLDTYDYSYYKDKNFISFKVEAYVGNNVVTKAKVVLTLINKVFISFGANNMMKADLDLTTNTISIDPKIFVYGTNDRKFNASIVPQSGGYENNFDIRIENRWYLILEVNMNNPIKYKGDKFIFFQIEARIDNNEFSRVWIVMQLLNTPKFEESLYKGEIDFQLKTLTHPQIILRNANQAAAKPEFKLDSSGGDRFSASLENGAVTLKFKEDNIYADYDDTFITINIGAMVDNYVMSNTVIVLENVGTLDPGTSTKDPSTTTLDPETTTLDPGTTTTMDPGSTVITFVKMENNIIIEPTFTGVFATFIATSSNSNDDITYNLTGKDIPGNLKIDENCGSLEAKVGIAPSYYILKVVAEGSFSKVQAEHEFLLIVETKVICKDSPLVPYAYKVVKIFEGKGSTEVLPAYDGNKRDDFEYCKVILDPDQTDENGEELFFIDEHGAVMSRNLDREAEYFKAMTKPQFLLTLKLKKKGGTICGEITRRKRDTIFSRLIGNLSLYDEIDNSPIKSTISVIVEDINDNEPKFGNNEVTVCYPNKDLVEVVRPTYITKVFASHSDSIESGWGIVTYSSNDAEIFVDPKAGYVFPSDIFYSSSKREFTITATDAGNHTDKLTLNVKIIDDDKISIIKMANADFDNLDNKLKELSLEAGIELNLLSAASIPADEKRTRNSLLKNEDFTLKLFIYGLNKRQEPVYTTDIERSLEEVSHVDVSKFEGNSCEESFIGEDDVTGLIAAVAVLGVLLVLFILGSLALWYFKFRKQNNNLEIVEEDPKPDIYIDSLDTYEKKFDSHLNNNNNEVVDFGPVARRPTGYVFNPPPVEEDEDMSSEQSEKEDDSTNDTEDKNSETNKTESDSGSDQIDSSGRRKSVSFNANIERFHIKKTADDEEESSDSDGGETEPK